MKYKILLAGNNKTIIDEFFTRLSNHFECQNTSSRYDDIISHIQYFEPAVFIYCLEHEDSDTLRKVSAIKRNSTSQNTPFLLLGSNADCQSFAEIAGNIADLTIHLPIGTSEIRDKVLAYIQQADTPEAPEPVSESEPDEYAELMSMLEENQKDTSPTKPTPKAEDPSRRKHILVVDDDSRMLKVLNRHLAEKYDVATAINGRLALKFLENKKTDLVLLDYEMPLDNGLTVLEKIRANPATHNLPVVFLTGTSDRHKIQQALALKPQGYLLKPIDHIKLLSTIKSLIG